MLSGAPMSGHHWPRWCLQPLLIVAAIIIGVALVRGITFALTQAVDGFSRGVLGL
jgi:hypothetical protein